MGAIEDWKLTPPKDEPPPIAVPRLTYVFFGINLGTLALLGFSYALLFNVFYIFGLLFILLLAPVSTGGGIMGLIWAVRSRRSMRTLPWLGFLIVNGMAMVAPVAIYIRCIPFKVGD